jgi:hypothetical protein
MWSESPAARPGIVRPPRQAATEPPQCLKYWWEFDEASGDAIDSIAGIHMEYTYASPLYQTSPLAPGSTYSMTIDGDDPPTPWAESVPSFGNAPFAIDWWLDGATFPPGMDEDYNGSWGLLELSFGYAQEIFMSLTGGAWNGTGTPRLTFGITNGLDNEWFYQHSGWTGALTHFCWEITPATGHSVIFMNDVIVSNVSGISIPDLTQDFSLALGNGWDLTSWDELQISVCPSDTPVPLFPMPDAQSAYYGTSTRYIAGWEMDFYNPAGYPYGTVPDPVASSENVIVSFVWDDTGDNASRTEVPIYVSSGPEAYLSEGVGPPYLLTTIKGGPWDDGDVLWTPPFTMEWAAGWQGGSVILGTFDGHINYAHAEQSLMILTAEASASSSAILRPTFDTYPDETALSVVGGGGAATLSDGLDTTYVEIVCDRALEGSLEFSEAVLSFPATSIPAGATITDAVLNIRLKAGTGTVGAWGVDVAQDIDTAVFDPYWSGTGQNPWTLPANWATYSQSLTTMADYSALPSAQDFRDGVVQAYVSVSAASYGSYLLSDASLVVTWSPA